ncbi:hypothetical protein ACN3XK_74325, partial [Actinomadura welshii]
SGGNRKSASRPWSPPTGTLRRLHAWRPAPLAVEARVDSRVVTDPLRGHLSTLVAPWPGRHPDVK